MKAWILKDTKKSKFESLFQPLKSAGIESAYLYDIQIKVNMCEVNSIPGIPDNLMYEGEPVGKRFMRLLLNLIKNN